MSLPKGTGKLRHRVVLQQPISTQSESGAETITWQDVATFWASVEPLAGRELVQAQQVQADSTFRAICRYRAGVTSQMRLSFNGRALNIGNVNSFEEKGEYLTLLCAEYQQ